MNRKSLERNIKIYPFYRAFSYDFLFLWTISILYLTWKGLSYSQTIYLDSVFMIVAFILQIPLTKLIHKVGFANSIRFACVLRIGFALLFLFGNNFWLFALANVFYGAAAAIQNVADAEILTYSLKNLGKEKDFSKIEGRGIYFHYVFEAIAAISSGYMFSYIHPTAPVWGTFVTCCILLLLACMLKNPSTNEVVASEENPDVLVEVIPEEPKKKTRKRKGVSYRTLLKDKFIVSLMVFCFCFWGIMSVYSTLSKVYFQDIGTPAYMFGYIYFVFKMVTALSSKYQFKFEVKRGVKSLIIFAILTILSFGINGIATLKSPAAIITIVIVSLMFIIQNAIRAPYRIFVKNYINVSMKKDALAKSLTLCSMAEYLGFSFITLTVAFVMDMTNNSFSLTNIIISGIIAIPLLVSIIIFVKELVKKYAKKHTIIRSDMENDL